MRIPLAGYVNYLHCQYSMMDPSGDPPVAVDPTLTIANQRTLINLDITALILQYYCYEG